MNKTLTALSGIKVGHLTHSDDLTGVTVVLFDKPHPITHVSYGGSTGLYNSDTQRNGKSDYHGHAIFISGGSWNGLQSGGEIAKRLIEKKIGFKTYNVINPNVTGAVVLDLGTRVAQFDPIFAREAVDNATSDPVDRGNVGAGTGTAVGKFRYFDNGNIFAGMKAGVGCSRVDLGNGIIVVALSVVNAVGNIILPNGETLAGNRDMDNAGEILSYRQLSDFVTKDTSNTTISIVGTNARFATREHYERIAHIATHGQVRAINPVNTSIDGDTVFVFSTEEISNPISAKAKRLPRGDYLKDIDVDIIGQTAADAVQESIYDACKQAKTIKLDGALNGVVPSSNDF